MKKAKLTEDQIEKMEFQAIGAINQIMTNLLKAGLPLQSTFIVLANAFAISLACSTGREKHEKLIKKTPDMIRTALPHWEQVLFDRTNGECGADHKQKGTIN